MCSKTLDQDKFIKVLSTLLYLSAEKRAKKYFFDTLKFSNKLFIPSDHPKGYLTKITTDYEAKHDEELSVQKGTMVKVSVFIDSISLF